MLNLKEQHALGNEQCPETSRKANDSLTNHEWDDAVGMAARHKMLQQALWLFVFCVINLITFEV